MSALPNQFNFIEWIFFQHQIKIVPCPLLQWLYAHIHFTKNKQAWYMKTVCIHMYIWIHTYMHIFLYIHILVLYRRKHLSEIYIVSIVSILLYVHSFWNNHTEQFSSLKAQLYALSYILVHLFTSRSLGHWVVIFTF